MSSSPVSGATPTPPPAPTASSDSNNQGGNYSTTNATLYLYTFLATLVLLLAVSSAIVIRSLILRRRHQRLVEEAIRTGTWMPNRLDSSTGRRRRDIGQKPKLWEVWPHPAGEEGEHEVDEKSKWGDVLPFYAAYVNPPTSSPQGTGPGPAENTADPSRLRPSHRFIMRPFARRLSPTSAQPTIATTTVPSTIAVSSTAGPPLLSTASPTAAPAVRVAVLIAMPSLSSSRKHGSNGESGPPPVVEIGVVEADVKDSEDSDTTPTTLAPSSMPKLTHGGS